MLSLRRVSDGSRWLLAQRLNSARVILFITSICRHRKQQFPQYAKHVKRLKMQRAKCMPTYMYQTNQSRKFRSNGDLFHSTSAVFNYYAYLNGVAEMCALLAVTCNVDLFSILNFFTSFIFSSSNTLWNSLIRRFDRWCLFLVCR